LSLIFFSLAPGFSPRTPLHHRPSGPFLIHIVTHTPALPKAYYTVYTFSSSPSRRPLVVFHLFRRRSSINPARTPDNRAMLYTQVKHTVHSGAVYTLHALYINRFFLLYIICMTSILSRWPSSRPKQCIR